MVGSLGAFLNLFVNGGGELLISGFRSSRDGEAGCKRYSVGSSISGVDCRGGSGMGGLAGLGFVSNGGERWAAGFGWWAGVAVQLRRLGLVAGMERGGDAFHDLFENG